MSADTPAAVRVRLMEARDIKAVLAVYAEGIAEGVATFEAEAPSWDKMNADHLPAPRLVAERTRARDTHENGGRASGASGGDANENGGRDGGASGGANEGGGAENGAHEIVGWAMLADSSSRCCYRGIVEASVYVNARARGCGAGRALLSALTAAAEANGFWSVQAEVFPENVASRKMLAACGFREIGYREAVGRMPQRGPHAGQWRDIVLYERRSPTVGRD